MTSDAQHDFHAPLYPCWTVFVNQGLDEACALTRRVRNETVACVFCGRSGRLRIPSFY
jgi:hypothetical protein